MRERGTRRVERVQTQIRSHLGVTQRSLFHTLRHIVRVTARNAVATVLLRERANDHHLAVLAASSWTMSP